MLKKYFLAAFLMFSSTFAAYGNYQGDLFVSPIVGAGYMQNFYHSSYYDYYDGSSYHYYDYNKGMVANIGLGLSFFVIGDLALITEFTFITNSFKDTGYNEKMNYLNIPIGINYFILEYFFLGGGFYYACYKAKILDMRNPEDQYGFFVDVGTSFTLPSDNVFRIYARYSHNLANYEHYCSEPDKKGKSVIFNIAYGILF